MDWSTFEALYALEPRSFVEKALEEGGVIRWVFPNMSEDDAASAGFLTHIPHPEYLRVLTESECKLLRSAVYERLFGTSIKK